MIMALLHTVETISFPLKWQYPDLAVQCVFFHQAETRKLRHNYLRLSKQPTDAWRPSCLWLWGDKVRWRCGQRKKVAGCHVVPGVETKPQGYCLNLCMPTEQKTWLFSHLLSITKTECWPLTGRDLDRWMARHVLFVAEKVGQQCGTLPPLKT